MTQNPVIEQLVKGAIERCKERVTAARTGGKAIRHGEKAGEGGITRGLKQSHGL